MTDFWLLAPFAQFTFMREALMVMGLLAISTAPIGAMLVLKKLSLVGDTLSHAMLPGVAVAFAVFGMNFFALSLGALAMAVIGGLLAGLIARQTELGEDASFAAFYLISLAAGICLMSAFGSSTDVLHFLFGNLLAVPDFYVQTLAIVTAVSAAVLGLFARQFLAEAFDPSITGGAWVYPLFLTIFVLNLVVAFFAIGTLLAMGIFLLPTIVARLLTNRWQHMIAVAAVLAFLGSVGGLLWSFYANLPAGPAIVLCLGLFYGLTLLWRGFGFLFIQRGRR